MQDTATVDVDTGGDELGGQGSDWIERVKVQLRLLAGPWVEEADAVWAKVAGHPLVRIAVHGGYDAGKSSLLKRFLVEDATPVPEWLTVGAHPTTAALDEVDSGGVTWIDSPGMAAGKAQHDGLAEQALTVTDGLLVVLPPQLVSGESSHLVSLLDGSFYNPVARRPLFPRGALVVVVAQMDTAGVSADDPEGFLELQHRKRAELTAILGRAGVVLPAEAVHLVAADPGQAGVLDQPSPDDYAGHESWDGVAPLRASLRELTARRTALRNAAAVRYWCRLGGEAYRRAEAERQHLVEVVDASRREQRAANLSLAELTALDQAARNRLRDVLRFAMQAMTVPPGDVAGQRGYVEKQLDVTVGAWFAEWHEKLMRFARDAAADQQLRASRPGSAALRDYVDSLLADLAAAEATDPEVGPKSCSAGSASTWASWRAVRSPSSRA